MIVELVGRTFCRFAPASAACSRSSSRARRSISCRIPCCSSPSRRRSAEFAAFGALFRLSDLLLQLAKPLLKCRQPLLGPFKLAHQLLRPVLDLVAKQVQHLLKIIGNLFLAIECLAGPILSPIVRGLLHVGADVELVRQVHRIAHRAGHRIVTVGKLSCQLVHTLFDLREADGYRCLAGGRLVENCAAEPAIVRSPQAAEFRR